MVRRMRLDLAPMGQAVVLGIGRVVGCVWAVWDEVAVVVERARFRRAAGARS